MTSKLRCAALPILAAIASLFIAGCSSKQQPAAEQLDPSELDLLPSIIASARRAVDEAQKQSGPIFRRDAHAKAHGCIMATFTVRDDLPEQYRTAVFVPGRTYKAWIRFSNGNALVQPDYTKDARGMAIKLMGVPGPHLLTSPDEVNAGTQDFVMINFPVFFNRNPAEYEKFIRYQADGSSILRYIVPGPNPADWKLKEGLVGARILGRISNPLYTQYYSMTAYALGVERSSSINPLPYRHAMKYSAKSCTPPDRRSPDITDVDYLRRGLADHLAEADACFEFLVQKQEPSENMPIEDPTVRWSERKAPFMRVATIDIPQQHFDTKEQNDFCENLSFSPWHGHVDHRPLGGLNRIRKAVYEGIAVYRHARNGKTFAEPQGWCLKLDGTACERPEQQQERY